MLKREMPKKSFGSFNQNRIKEEKFSILSFIKQRKFAESGVSSIFSFEFSNI